MMQRSLISFGSFLFVLLSSLLCFSGLIYYNNAVYKEVTAKAQFAPKLPPVRGNTNIPVYHSFGAFSVNTPTEALAAASDGIHYSIHYGAPHSATSPQGLALQKVGIKEYSSRINDFMVDYECHKALRNGHTEYCDKEPVSQMTSETAVLNGVKAYLQEVQKDPLIVGHWVLDDWPKWDYGSAKQMLVAIHQLIRQYTPQLPAICGFGAGFGLQGTIDWNPSLAANFSPQACDEVGLYIYADPPDSSTNPPNTDDYDWSMSKLLPRIASSLQAQGWDSRKAPWIGIVQAFGGKRTQSPNKVDVTPSAKNMTTQALSFCKAGAKDVFWYSFDNASEYTLDTVQTPMNSASIKAGIKSGMAACKAWWSSTAHGSLHR